MYKLLIADDESFIRNGLVKHIDWYSMGIGTVEQASDGLSALKLAKEFLPDIILTDIRMPNLTGIEFAKQIRTDLPNCKIIFMSGYSDKEYLKSAIHLKAISYIEKPIDLEEVKNTLKQAVNLCIYEDEQKVKQNTMTSMIKENELVTVSQLVLELVKNKFNELQLNHVLKFANINISDSNAYFVEVIRFFVEEDHHLIDLDILTRKIDGVIKDRMLGCMIGYREADYYIVIFYRLEGDKRSFEEAEIIHITQQIEKSLIGDNPYFIGASRTVRGFNHIQVAYNDAVVALQELYYKGINKYAIYKETHDANYELKEDFYLKIEEELEAENKEALLQMIGNLTNEFKKHRYLLPDFSREIYYKVVLSVYEAANIRGIKFSSMKSYNALWDALSKWNFISEVEHYVIDTIEKYFDEVDKAKGTKKVVSDVMKIISNHYQNPNLSIKMIGQMLYLSDTYLCFVFKKETNKTINQFIREIRIEKAKELFIYSKYKIYDIANLVGYSDNNYFAKIFKKETNMTPSEYKEKYDL